MASEKEQLQKKLAELQEKHQRKVTHFNWIHSVAKHMKPEIRELEKQMNEIELRIQNAKKG